MKNIKNSNYFSSLKISLIYLLISSIYIIFSDYIIALIVNKRLSVETLTTIQTYKGLVFVFVTSIILFVLIQREIKTKRITIKELELQKDNLLNLTEENEKIKTKLQSRNIYIETILKYLPIGLAVNKIDEGDAVYMNKSFTDIYGWTKIDLNNPENFFKNVYPDEEYRKTIQERVLKDIKSGDPNRMRWEGIEITTSSGKKKYVKAQNIPVFEQNLMISMVLDITERVEREKVIDNYQKSLKKLTTEISLTEEKQRKEIASNIHDNLSQLLVISKLKLNDLQNDVTTVNAQKELKAVIQYITEALENSRKITYDLCPPVLYEMGLIETMYWLAEKTQHEHYIKTSFTTDLNKIKLSESKLILIFRIVQELVNNTVKHAKAHSLNIEIQVINELLEIIVSDDGKGFNKNDLPKAKVGEGGFGLFAVKERVQNLDGKISINSKKNKGTTVKISVPLI